MHYYLKVLKQYADFSGRARRAEYWMFTLINFFLSLVIMTLDAVLGGIIGYGIFYLIYILFIFIPNLAVTVRRLHDVGKSGWMYFIVLIPFVGAIWLIILLVTEGQRGPNKWGKDPKEVLSPEVA